MGLLREFSAGIIPFRRENDKRLYLLLHYELGHWDFPKGNIEKGEKAIDAACRELKEETGISKVEVLPGFKEKTKYFYRKGEDLVFKQVTYFLGQVYSEDVGLSFEHIGYRWCGFEEAMRQITFKDSKDVLQKAEDFLSQASRENSQGRRQPD